MNMIIKHLKKQSSRVFTQGLAVLADQGGCSLTLTGLLTLFVMHRLTVSSACLMLCTGSGTAGLLSGILHLGPRYFRRDLFISDYQVSLRYGG